MLFKLLFVVSLSCSASAGLIPRQTQTPCSFIMNAVGSPSGSVLEDTVGENRIGGTYPQGNYYILNGTLYDSLDHNCIIDSVSRQLQCTAGELGAPTTFSFADDGDLLYNGTESWLACPADGPGDDFSWNIFSNDKVASGCNSITLRTGGFNCTALGRSSSSSSVSTSLAASSTSSSSALTTPATQSATNTSSVGTSATPTATSNASCPTDISSGTYQFPHLIVPVSPNASDHSFGNQYSAYISPINTTLFNFDIPSAGPYSGTCALLFLFPFGGATYFSGIEEEEGEEGGLDFALLADVANNATTYDTMGVTAADYGKVEVLPGNNYTVATFGCQAGMTVTYAVSSRGGVELDYFQQAGSNPIGLYIAPCGSA